MPAKKVARFVAIVDGVKQEGERNGTLDIGGARNAEIQISSDGTVLWVHLDGRTVLRVSRIEQRIQIEDPRWMLESDNP